MTAADGEDGRPRDQYGRWMRTPASAERDAAAAELRAEGKNFTQIAEALGFCDRGEAWRAVQRALVAIVKEPAEKLRQVEAAKLDELYVHALEVLEKDHPVVSYGEVVNGPDGQPLVDPAPRLNAIRELRGIRESYRKLYGLDAPTRVSVDAEQLGAEILSLLDTATPDGTDDDGA